MLRTVVKRTTPLELTHWVEDPLPGGTPLARVVGAAVGAAVEVVGRLEGKRGVSL